MSTQFEVRDLMTRRIITVFPSQPIGAAIPVLTKNRVSGALVVDEHGDLVGVLSGRDIMRAIVKAAYDDLPEGTVADYMSAPACTIKESATLPEAAALFVEHPFRRLPVVDNRDRLVGVVSRRDVLEAFEIQIRRAQRVRFERTFARGRAG